MKVVSARQQGDTYQKRVFWLQACRLFAPHTKVVRVGYEIGSVPHFDDIEALYSEPIRDAHGELISADYYQVKWHVDHAGTLTADALTDPSFISSQKTSLLQRLHEAYRITSTRNQCSRFNFVTTWAIRHDDVLAKLVSGRDGELRLDVLFGRSPAQRFARLVEQWSDHLGVDHEELKQVLSRLRLSANSNSLDQLTRRLSDNMARVGLRPIDDGSRTNPYDSLIERLLSEGRNSFTVQEIQKICEAEGLWHGRDSGQRPPYVGIRSFLRFAEHMEDETDYILDLVDLFDGREISVPEYWNTKVGPRVSEYMTESVGQLDRCQLNLAVHSSIAFAVGYELDPKSGTQVSLLQNSAGGSSLWEITLESATSREDLWKVSEMDVNSGGNAVGIVLSVTHNALPEVLGFIQDHVPEVGSLLVFEIEPATGPMAIKDGLHAWGLAQEVVETVRDRNTARTPTSPLHVFSAAPNGLVFFLGRLARSLGPIQLYEHAFESEWSARYQESIRLPVAKNGEVV